MYVMYVCYVCMLCMYVMYVCYVCMYVMYVCYVCMLCMYVIYRWLSNQMSYMTNRGFEKRPNKVIYDNLNGHRLFNMFQMIIDFGCMV